MIEPSKAPEMWKRCLAVIRPALLLAPRTYLQDLWDRLAADGIQAAVAHRDTAALFDWIVRLFDRQGISNAAAIGFAERHGGARWDDIDSALTGRPTCPKLTSHWHFFECGFRKGARTCSRPDLIESCVLPRLPARKGGLNQAAFGLALFIRDICDGDLVGWIDGRLAVADPGVGVALRGVTMREALLKPLTNIVGTGAKVWSMILAELLLGGDPERERWTTTGASFIAIDSLVHAYFHRTGILRRLDAEHIYGAACYAPGGCAKVVTALAERIDAREFNSTFPAHFPRWVQFAVWWFCAADGFSICNSFHIDDRVGCRQQFCPTSGVCDRLPAPAPSPASS